MADEIIFLVEDAPEGGYTAHALNHSIFTEAETLIELKAAIKTRCDAISKKASVPRSCVCILCGTRSWRYETPARCQRGRTCNSLFGK